MEAPEDDLLSPEIDMSMEDAMSPAFRKMKSRRPTRAVGPIVTSSMLVFTPEEREWRQQKRLEKSKCCVQESWKSYQSKVNSVPVQSKKESNFSHYHSMGVLYDPLVEKRRRFLTQKFSPLLKTFSMIQEAALPPYIRPTPPKELNKKGRRVTLPRVTLNIRPDINEAVSLPRTFAATTKWTQISNLNFQDEEHYLDQWTQTPCTWLPQVLRQLSNRLSTNRMISERNSLKPTDTRKDSIPIRLEILDVNKDWLLDSTTKDFISETQGIQQVSIRDHMEILEAKERKFSDTMSKGSIFSTDMTFDLSTDTVEAPKLKRPYTEGVFDLLDIPLDDMGNPIGQTTGFCEWCGNPILPIPDPFTLKSVWDRTTLYCCTKYMDFVNEISLLEGKLAAIEATQKMNVKPHTKFFSSKSKRKLLEKRDFIDKKQDESVDTFDLPWDPLDTKYDADLWDDSLFEDPNIRAYMYADIVAMASGTYIHVQDNPMDKNETIIEEETREAEEEANT
ncbi:glutamate-rich protein 6-like isoform X7 [Biomphalaria pfeifferi]|uniref:Glutamate-rich protein 6-like isoform X7 n=1 Tax=Biomphalaria pfeifferi TaxID=112525 RepID=A0AAD8FME3_BIOPF|nr:glutamate-rich protein 6-like isoform X7 [Biomphalaria pfeifferi]